MGQSPFSQEQLDILNQPLDAKRVKHRPGGGGVQLSYIEGHDVINTANHVFGFGNWGYDLLGVELNTVSDEKGEIVGSYYAARIRVTVAGCVPITEEGVCAVSEGRNPRARIDAHDMSRKGAITDALKRALRCFGNQFGNSLYDSDLVDGQPRNQARPARPNNMPAPEAIRRPAPPAAALTPAPVPPPANVPAPVAASRPAPRPAAVAGNGVVLASDQQINGIRKIAASRKISEQRLEAELMTRYGTSLQNLTDADARDFITYLNNIAA